MNLSTFPWNAGSPGVWRVDVRLDLPQSFCLHEGSQPKKDADLQRAEQWDPGPGGVVNLYIKPPFPWTLTYMRKYIDFIFQVSLNWVFYYLQPKALLG